MAPAISIILITYNRANFLLEAIASVLAQTFADWELIIIDDNSTDNTREIVEKLCQTEKKIKYIVNKNNFGISKSRNIGLTLAWGKYIAILDSDDVWADQDKLKNQYEFLEKNPDYALIGGGVIVIDKNGRERKRYLNPETDKKIRKKILIKNPFAHSSVLYLKEAATKLEGYDTTLKTLEDYDLYLKIGAKYKFYNLNKYQIKYRAHDGNISARERLNMMKLNISLIKKYKNSYPYYRLAILRRKIRLLVYKLLS
jgi:glycosyltransferase involved in cell wall biosynthesis